MKKLLDDLCAEAGTGVSYEYLSYSNVTVTSLTEDNIWWTTFKETCDKL